MGLVWCFGVLVLYAGFVDGCWFLLIWVFFGFWVLAIGVFCSAALVAFRVAWERSFRGGWYNIVYFGFGFRLLVRIWWL